jgi:protein-S-isoprenylcysteine O-methyltransferase Ste14
MKNLVAKTLAKTLAVAACMGLLVFVPAGTLRYWQAWVYLPTFIGASLLITIDLIRRDPALLERRSRGGPKAEKRPAQKIIMLFAAIGFVGLLVVPAFDYRYGWSSVPSVVALAGDLMVAIGFYFILLVFRENTFASSTIEIADNQKIISTGPYSLVRHPMYASAFLYVVGTPLALGSYWGLLAVAFMLVALIWRLLDEEKFLTENLSGYAEYQQKVRYRLIPHLW